MAPPVPSQAQVPEDRLIVLKTMDSCFFGGIVTRLKNGPTFHGGHGRARYSLTQVTRDLPVVMWRGIGQSGNPRESAPDGREALLSRANGPVCIIEDPPRPRRTRPCC